jgi:hypothetical protein
MRIELVKTLTAFSVIKKLSYGCSLVQPSFNSALAQYLIEGRVNFIQKKYSSCPRDDVYDE